MLFFSHDDEYEDKVPYSKSVVNVLFSSAGTISKVASADIFEISEARSPFHPYLN